MDSIYFWKDEHGWWWGDPEFLAFGPSPTFEDCLDAFYQKPRLRRLLR